MYVSYFLSGGIFFISGVLQGLIGFGAAMVAMPLLVMILSIKTAVPVCNLCCVGMNILMCYTLRGAVKRKNILPLIIGAIPGVVIGTATLQTVDERIVTIMLGILVVAYALYSLFIRPIVLNISPNWGVVAGLLTGYVGAITSVGGPPAALYSSIMGWHKEALKGTLAAFFLFASITVTLGHSIGGLITSREVGIAAVGLPFILGGAYLGNHWSSHVNDASYQRGVLIILILMGLALINNGIG